MTESINMDDLLIKYVLGEATPAERALVDQWLAADAGNRARYEQFRTIWSISRQTAVPVSRNSGEALQRFRQRQRSTVERGNGKEESITGTHRGKWLMAAAFAGALLLGAGGYYLIHPARRATARNNATPPQQETFRQQETSGQQAAVISWQQVVANNTFRPDTLPDGSVVTLNRHSSVMWAANTHDSAGRNSHRGMTLQLEGEAFFSVVHDPATPFVVRVNDVTVRVLGTSFDIRSAGKDSMTIIVETGAVRVSKGKDSLTAHAGEQINLLPTGRLHRQPVTNMLYGYYLDRPMVCDSVALKEVVAMLNEAYDVHVRIGRPELNDLPLSTVFHHEPLDKILAIIGATFDLTIVRQGDSIILQ